MKLQKRILIKSRKHFTWGSELIQEVKENNRRIGTEEIRDVRLLTILECPLLFSWRSRAAQIVYKCSITDDTELRMYPFRRCIDVEVVALDAEVREWEPKRSKFG